MRPSMWMTGTCASSSFAVMVLRQLLDHALGGAAPRLDPLPQRLVGLRLEVLERQLLELVLDLAHAEAVGDRRVDVARLLRDLDPALLRQVVQRPHVVQAVGELDQDDADVVDHRQQHLAEVLRLPLLARRELDRRRAWSPLRRRGRRRCRTARWIRSIGVWVSSTMSWSRPAAIATTSSFMSASRSATSSGWTRYGSPEWRTCPLCSKAEKTYARLSSSMSASGLPARTFSTRSSNRIMNVGV